MVLTLDTTREAVTRVDPLGFQLLCCVHIQCLGARMLCFGCLTLLSSFWTLRFCIKKILELEPQLKRPQRCRELNEPRIISARYEQLVFNTHSTTANSTWNNLFFIFFYSLHLANNGLAITHPVQGDFLKVFAHPCYFNSNLSND